MLIVGVTRECPELKSALSSPYTLSQLLSNIQVMLLSLKS